MLESGRSYQVIRLYFNSKKDHPLIWSVDDGNQANELKADRVVWYSPGCTEYTDRPVNDDSPVAWVEFFNVILDIIGDTVTLTAVR